MIIKNICSGPHGEPWYFDNDDNCWKPITDAMPNTMTNIPPPEMFTDIPFKLINDEAKDEAPALRERERALALKAAQTKLF